MIFPSRGMAEEESSIAIFQGAVVCAMPRREKLFSEVRKEISSSTSVETFFALPERNAASADKSAIGSPVAASVTESSSV